MTLTEQWKKGELPTGDYYVKPKNGQMFVYHINHSVKHIYHNHAGEIKEVIAKTPTYKEWQELNKQRNQFIRDIKDLAYIQEENQQLKELLLSSRGFVDKERITLETSGFGHNEYCRRTKELLSAIDNAIGEKKC